MAKLKDMHKIEWPREKLLQYGSGKLSNSELLAIILRTGTSGMDVMELSRKILKKFPKSKLVDANLDDLKNTIGIGEAKACEMGPFKKVCLTSYYLFPIFLKNL